MSTIKNVKLNKFHDKLLGASVFLNAEFIAPFVKTNEDTHLNIEIELTQNGILIKPLGTWHNKEHR